MDEVRLELCTRLRQRQREIERAVLDRVVEIEIPSDEVDAEYVAGMLEATAEAVDYALCGIEAGSVPARAIPMAASSQARRDARSGIPLDTILRRCHAGDRVLYEVIVREAHNLPSDALQEILRDHDPVVDHLAAEIAAEYTVEMERISRSPAQRLGEQIKKLLTGPIGREVEIDYALQGWHLGMIARGSRSDGVIQEVGNALGRLVLCVPAGEPDTFWAWLGGPRPLMLEDLMAVLDKELPSEMSVALGEARQGLDGWRLTHREAQIALRVALYRPQLVTKCRDVLLLAAITHDRHVAAALIATYLRPLEGRGEQGHVLRRTLRAYFKSGQNAASAAAALKVARNTVERHLRTVELRIDQNLHLCGPQIQVALLAEELMGAVDKGLPRLTTVNGARA
jgi:diguanylate cyclase with GGDEF domain/PucR-like helix-turn-helix protein